jgi:hypothetical protein
MHYDLGYFDLARAEKPATPRIPFPLFRPGLISGLRQFDVGQVDYSLDRQNYTQLANKRFSQAYFCVSLPASSSAGDWPPWAQYEPKLSS